ncbi:MAG: TusE/DsrC/DsvC family sulfur relay protein [Gammaproteobacteria bacterium]|nr:TusE/DsrC/DsvC family sulfur relay protein [Gammaproteobacteria bacterium]
MAYEINGKTVETTANGYLVNTEDWNKEVAERIAVQEGIMELTPRHWDIINYLREEYFNNNQNQPNERTILKAMNDKWGKATSKDTYDLFPQMPSKQGGKIAGLPESRRKGGY